MIIGYAVTLGRRPVPTAEDRPDRPAPRQTTKQLLEWPLSERERWPAILKESGLELSAVPPEWDYDVTASTGIEKDLGFICRRGANCVQIASEIRRHLGGKYFLFIVPRGDKRSDRHEANSLVHEIRQLLLENGARLWP
jgi:hypothetical protein